MADPAAVTHLPCIIDNCPWEADLRDGIWVCEKHNDSFIWDNDARDEKRVIWPKIAEMDARIRGATERIIRRLHLEPDAFAMFMALTEVALGMEERVKKLPEAKPRPGKGGVPV